MVADAAPPIAARVAALERARGVEVVTASIAKADVYPELPWRAGALAASIAALVIAIGDVLRPDWVTSTTLLVALATVMLVGAGVALLAIFVPPFARLFLARARRDVEVRQFAQSFFLERQLFRTRKRQGILILVARFEHGVPLTLQRVAEHRTKRVLVLDDQDLSGCGHEAGADGQRSQPGGTPALRASSSMSAICLLLCSTSFFTRPSSAIAFWRSSPIFAR